MRTMAAGKFKAECLGVLDEVQAKREPVLVTKHGKPVAKVVPLDFAEGEDPLEAIRFPGKIEIVGDIEAPIYTEEEYEQFYREKLDRLK
jgi:prevent-host-death family protein